jgi:hypothetical protein
MHQVISNAVTKIHQGLIQQARSIKSIKNASQYTMNQYFTQ